MNKEGRKRNVIIISYWLGISLLVWFSRDKEMPFSERMFSFIAFAAIYIVISLCFSKTLFRKTIQNRKTLPLVVKFFLMSGCMAVGLHFMDKMFCSLEQIGLFQSTYYLDETLPFMGGMRDIFPSVVASNLIFCVILLYYEYSLLQQTNLEAQLKVLHAQVNPHSMFNVLNYLYVLIQKDTELASALLLKYSDTLRYQLYSGKSETVKLGQEVQYLKDFIDVEKFRWEDKLDVCCTWQIEDTNMDIPPLLFIPFIENAFKHVSRSESNKGYIHIHFVQKGRFIALEVENSKSNKSVKKKTSGIGLENIKARLEIHYGRRYHLSIKETDNTYLSVLKLYT
ncbi:histidine kinase [Parabacteroides sp. OttesenSCG-928-J18]|nr:histidine kinase [Parabacteroides sp. OttesenSCG-928-J18]